MDLFLYAETRQSVSPIVNCEDHARSHAETVFRGLLKRRESLAVSAETVMCTHEYVASGAKQIGWVKREWLCAFDAAFSALVNGHRAEVAA